MRVHPLSASFVGGAVGTVASSKNFVRNRLVTSHVQFVFIQNCGFVINKLLFNVSENPLTTTCMCIRGLPS